jgi:hypothetical protein
MLASVKLQSNHDLAALVSPKKPRNSSILNASKLLMMQKLSARDAYNPMSSITSQICQV